MEGTIWGDDAMDSSEAAAYCGMPGNLVAEVQGMEGATRRVGGRPCFLKPDLDKWMAEPQAQGGSSMRGMRRTAIDPSQARRERNGRPASSWPETSRAMGQQVVEKILDRHGR